MARTVNEQEYARKRGEILAAAQRLVFVKGYESMTIQDILADLHISSGAFYHYFDSKPALLEAFIQGIREATEGMLLPIVHDPHLPALEKLKGYLGAFDRMRVERKAEIVELEYVWYTDGNALVRRKVDEAVRAQQAPLLAEIVRQGVQEGVFTAAYPDRAGDVIVSLLQGMGDAHARLLLSAAQERDGRKLSDYVEEIVTVHATYMDAIERVLGAPAGSLYRADAETALMWVTAMRASCPA